MANETIHPRALRALALYGVAGRFEVRKAVGKN